MTATPFLEQAKHSFGYAWLLLCVALSIHVLDEALTDFLSVYNPAVQAIRKRFPLLPLTVFSFRVWLGGLAGAVALAFCVTPLAFGGSGFVVAAAYPLGILMAGNALGHIGASIYRRRFMPGVYSSPLLLLASLYLLICAERIRHAG
jgi:hypothetical protein